jgi:hypothetical protein
MFKKYALTALASGAMIVALAPTASAHDTRTHTCTERGTALGGTGVFRAGSSQVGDRCVVTTTVISAPVASGTIVWEDPETRTVGPEYTDAEFVYGDPVTTTDVHYGEWRTISVPTTTTVTSGTGKSKNTKTVTTTTTHQERTVTSTVTHTYPTFEITYVLQDVEQVRDGEEATTITTTTTTRTYSYKSGATTFAVSNPGAVEVAPVTVVGDPVESAGEPILHDDVVVEGSQDTEVVSESDPVLVESTVENGGIVTEDPLVTTEEQTVVTKDTCVANKNKSKNREAC